MSNLAEALGSSHLSLAEIGRRAGVDASYVLRISKGTNKPARLVIEALTRVLDVPRRDRDRWLAEAGYMPWRWSPELAGIAELLELEPSYAAVVAELTTALLAQQARLKELDCALAATREALSYWHAASALRKTEGASEAPRAFKISSVDWHVSAPNPSVDWHVSISAPNPTVVK